MIPFDRRALLKSLAAAPFAAIQRTEADTTPGEKTARFDHGVASGDPAVDSVVIWTRVSGLDDALEVQWELATDTAFKQKVATGTVWTSAHRDFTVKAVPNGLAPGQRYFYRFKAGDSVSVMGRTRTLPVGSLQSLGIAVASCSNFAFGYFNAYDAIAHDKGIEFVLHLGDYIYEYGVDGWGAEVADSLGRRHEPAHEIVSLQDYRKRHAQYKTDAGSQAMHAAHPLLMVWDDHESANNPWVGGAQNHQTHIEGLWRDRRAASLRAYFEWMPIREPDIEAQRLNYWRHYRFGDLAALATLETRHSARAQQIDYGDHIARIQSLDDARTFEREVLGAPGRAMLSEAMETFLEQHLGDTDQAGIPWRLIGNPMPMAKMPVPDVAAAGMSLPGSTSAVPGATADLLWKGQWRLPFYLDTWDGYPWARERFYQLCQRQHVRDLLVLTGDSHSFWSNQLFDEQGQSMGIELGTAGISSPGDFVEQGFDAETAARIDALFSEHVPEVRWTDNLHQGYIRLTLERTQARADFVAVSTVLSPDYSVFVLRTEILERREDTLVYRDPV